MQMISVMRRTPCQPKSLKCSKWTYLFQFSDIIPSEDMDASVRCSQRLASAYQRARNTEDGDEEVECLRKAGVILPNGFQQIEPLFLAEGEMLLSSFNQGKAWVEMLFSQI